MPEVGRCSQEHVPVMEHTELVSEPDYNVIRKQSKKHTKPITLTHPRERKSHIQPWKMAEHDCFVKEATDSRNHPPHRQLPQAGSWIEGQAEAISGCGS